MKNIHKIITILLAAVLSLGSSAVALADSHLNIGSQTGIKVTVGERDGDNGTNSNERFEASTTSREDEHVNVSSSMGSSSFNAENHGAVVSAFVHNLKTLADRSGGIGAQVRVIAQEQDQSASTTVEAMNKIEHRNALLSILFGTDGQSVVTLKAVLASTTQQILALQALASSTPDVALRADLNSQITVLQNEQAKLQAFVDTNDNRFSLFGWLLKMFR